MDKDQPLKVRSMQKEDLDYILEWRNHPEVRRYMINSHKISKSEHQAWFEKSSRDDSKALLIIENNVLPIGYVTFAGITGSSSTNWGFYVAPSSPRGTGMKLCTTALHFAFTELKVHKVAGQVFDFNFASIKIHQNLGFTREGVLRQHFLSDKSYHDVFCFGILASEYHLKHNRNLYQTERSVP